MARSARLFSKFYWQDWLTDPALRLCSFGARGLWMDLLALMWMSTRQGYLIVNGVAPTCSQLARLTGASQREVENLLGELQDANVFSKDEAQTIFCRRMLRDITYREQQSEYGHRGGNPLLTDNAPVKRSVKAPLKGNDNGDVKGGVKLLEAEAEAEREAETDSISSPRGSQVPTSSQPLPSRPSAEGGNSAPQKKEKGGSGFALFYAAYPNKKARRRAEAAWKSIKNLPPVEVLIAAVRAQERSDQWQRGIIPHPATWLRAGQWEDELGVAPPHPSAPSSLPSPDGWERAAEIVFPGCDVSQGWHALTSDTQGPILEFLKKEKGGGDV